MCNGEGGIGTWTSSWGFAVASLLPRLLSGSSLTFKAQLLLDVHITHLTTLVYSFEYSQVPYVLLPRQSRLGASPHSVSSYWTTIYEDSKTAAFHHWQPEKVHSIYVWHRHRVYGGEVQGRQ